MKRLQLTGEVERAAAAVVQAHREKNRAHQAMKRHEAATEEKRKRYMDASSAAEEALQGFAKTAAKSAFDYD